jgi:hypothetical protein
MKDRPKGKLHPIESKYMADAAVVGFVLALLPHGRQFDCCFWCVCAGWRSRMSRSTSAALRQRERAKRHRTQAPARI